MRYFVQWPLFLIILLIGFQQGWGNTGALGVSNSIKPNLRLVQQGVHSFFAENMGQIPAEHVRFYTRVQGIGVCLTTSGEIHYTLSPDFYRSQPKPARFFESPNRVFHNATGLEKAKAHVLKEIFVGSHGSPLKGLEEIVGRANYLLGNDPTNWKRNVPLYRAVSLGEVYDHVEVKLVHRNNQVEKIITIHPEGKVSVIQLSIEGALRLFIGEEGDLRIETERGFLRFKKPAAYQEVHGRRIEVPASYRLISNRPNTYGFAVGAYDKSARLFIDPVLQFTTCFSGSHSTGDVVHGMALDKEGNIYLTGQALSEDFPTVNPIQYKLPYSEDVFVMKLSPSGDKIIYSTFLGGRDSDIGRGIAVDELGNAYVCGHTYSMNFPTKNGFQWLSETPTRVRFSRGNGAWYSTFPRCRYKPSLPPPHGPLSKI